MSSKVAQFEQTISKDHPIYKPEKGRYWLYLSAGCPFAQRTWITRAVKNLTDVIGVTVVHWKLDDLSWKLVSGDASKLSDSPHSIDGGIISSKNDSSTLFGDLSDNNEVPFVDGTVDPNYGITSIKELYDMMPNVEYTGTHEFPILWDLKTKTIVNNNWDQLPGILNSAFADLPETQGTIDLVPASISKEVNEFNEWLSPHINFGVYEVGLATKQGVYEKNLVQFYKDLDTVEEKLKTVYKSLEKEYGSDNQEEILKKFFLFNGQLTESDIRLFATIIRFDPVYAIHFKLNWKTIRNDYNYIHLWLRNLYWNHKEFSATTNFNHIKLLYYRSQLEVNPNGLVVYGPEKDILEL
ncbi:similar to Saccharomyces cerevisiae YKR076W ECM4 Omega class glutathione transferase [Maudiozyma saulgeensis]|uniref:Similar to Saccharomyces cerevisiae YKR076W ECM4 Omega class glutathione transferase n=1 Tax=Maudiozyma saulgeensis TaxID=1789683 RepID=A0A1X7RB31_9SACH|nr:similar to Saccharomyces cerevisiae YKR076W ECM4 Omega class glutathione transferase [Kazachstania saulgeensis]